MVWLEAMYWPLLNDQELLHDSHSVCSLLVEALPYSLAGNCLRSSTGVQVALHPLISILV